MSKKTKNLSLIAGGVIILGILSFWLISNNALAPSVESFEECAEEYTILKSYPPQCKTPDGRTFIKRPSAEEINSFSKCAKYYPVMESYPRKCSPEGSTKTFVEPSCQAGTGTDVAILTITDAKEIAKESECGDRLTNSYQCNENSGTWWIDMTIEKEGCSPACVVDVKNRQAKINWRCTGFIPESEQSN